jgi:hypothetical protein
MNSEGADRMYQHTTRRRRKIMYLWSRLQKMACIWQSAKNILHWKCHYHIVCHASAELMSQSYWSQEWKKHLILTNKTYTSSTVQATLAIYNQPLTYPPSVNINCWSFSDAVICVFHVKRDVYTDCCDLKQSPVSKNKNTYRNVIIQRSIIYVHKTCKWAFDDFLYIYINVRWKKVKLSPCLTN